MIIKRALLSKIRQHLATRDVFTLIIGPRQAGKTFVMNILKKELEKKGKKTLSLNMDITGDRPFFSSQERLIQKIIYTIGDKNGYVFLDEIQRKENAGLFLKGLYDKKLPYKFIVSGSGSLELKEKIHESLPGRKRMFELMPLSFEEFVQFKSGGNSNTFFKIHKETAPELLDEYLNFGGYPRVVLAKTIEEKLAEIDDIYKSYLQKDIESMLRLTKPDSFINLVRILASQVGNLINVAELSNTIGISQQTVDNYLWYLEKTYIIQKVTPYFKNIRSEISKASMCYFVDLGMKNYSLNQFGTATIIKPPSGFLFQNFIYNYLKSSLDKSPITLHFWRTQDKAEVDIIINTGLEVIPIEVKYAFLKSPQKSRSFTSFLTKYKPKKAYFIHLGEYFEDAYENTKISYLPFYQCQSIVKNITPLHEERV